MKPAAFCSVSQNWQSRLSPPNAGFSGEESAKRIVVEPAAAPLADTVLPQLRDMAARPVSKRNSGGQASSHKSAEMWRLLGALELLPVQTKIAVGKMIVETLVAGRLAPVRPALCWTLGRLGARQPSYGPLNMVVPADVLSGWLEQRTAVDDSSAVFFSSSLALMQAGPPHAETVTATSLNRLAIRC